MRLWTKLATASMIVALVAPGAHAAGDLEPLEVFVDPLYDGVFTADATPPDQDLVAGYIGETANDLIFTWKVAGLTQKTVHDVAGPAEEAAGRTIGVPVASWYWEFSLDAPNDEKEAELFSVSVHHLRGGSLSAELQSNCRPDETAPNLIVCDTITGARVTPSFDYENSSVSASVRRRDLKDQDGIIVAVDGALLIEEILFNGIASYTTASTASAFSLLADEADMYEDYVLGMPRG